MNNNVKSGLLLISPALLVICLLFLWPLGYSMVSAFQSEQGVGIENFIKAYDLYSKDIFFTLVIVVISCAIIGIVSILLAGLMVLGNNPRLTVVLRWLYRWPLFIPFVVTAQLMRTFLAKNGMMNNIFVSLGLLEPLQAQSLLDWRGIIIAFVWKQTPFVILLVAGAMSSLNRQMIEAAQLMGDGKLRILFNIVVPQVRSTIATGLILSFVMMMSVLSIPLMINSQAPTMITVDMAWRINSYGDYGVANALAIISYLLTSCFAWYYLKRGVQQGGSPK